MRTIKVNKDINIDKLKISGKGIESIIYEIDGHLIKIFKTTDTLTLKNKEAKLEILSHTDLACKPICLVKNNNALRGYIMKKQDGYTTLETNCLSISKKNKIDNLYKIKEKLEGLHKLGIIYGDMNLKNIITNQSNIEFCDLDNCYINGHNFDMLNNNQKYYLNRAQVINEQMDNYIFNLLTAAYICKIYEPYIIEYLKDYNLPLILLNKKNQEILDKMLNGTNLNQEELDLFINHVNTLRKKKISK